ncbi:M1 family aminopeptidase [Actinomycetospora sp. NBRC 106378]|uniref:M1 family aminopeptidase n=1 Tax=Actinomycetospora sp. NBRC 106378 TaxID=3032208 RepID=UPI0024A44C37|nr:M1 family aminopeptidase [Actinomycetospora sp. NBRC 106378]GLZ52107.1 metallopeptidase [Actinomycetospora sp. NBRC 106378]
MIRTTLVALLATLLVACSPGPTTPPRAAPDPARPVVSLAFDVADDLRGATGREQVAFTPDAPVCELVFRAWPNAPVSAAAGSSLRVDTSAVDGTPVAPRVEAAGAPAGAPGTLVTLPLPSCVPAGRTVTVDLGFTLALGPDADDRLGTSRGVAWFGSAFPLLAWVRGQGWVRTPAATAPGENAVSEEFTLRSLEVTAPSGLAVSGVGRAVGTTDAAGRTTHRFTADAVRDVAVAVGPYEVVERDVAGTRLHLFLLPGTRTDPDRWVTEIDTAIGRLQPLLGPFPYPDLWVALAPGQSSGIEYPGALQFGDTRPGDLPSLATHELAHQWFYSLVGNDQGLHPWMDEAFATWAEAVATGRPDEYSLDDVPRRLDGRLGDPLSAWDGSFDRYETGVYVQGAATLLEARRRVGAPAFDDAVRRYLAVNAHRVATPADVAAAFRDLPAVTDLLTSRGALPHP